MANGTEQAELDSILLVDDDPTNLAVLRETLKGQDYRLLMAKSGEQALSVAAKARPALVLLDVMMPGIDGFETCERMKADPVMADAAVIFLSALDEAKDKVRGLELGAVDFISKPFDPQEVIARVDTHLKIRRLERSLLRKNRELEEVNKRMRMDLEAAARVQQSFLPQSMPEVTGARFEWRYRPCEELAGDYLNVAVLDERRVGMFVVDVCGHGVPSSLLTVTVARNLNASPGGASVLSSVDDAGQVTIASPSEVAKRLNELYPMSANANLYFTFLYGVLNVETREFRFVSAGNPGPVVARAGGGVEVHDAPAVPIGLLPESEYEDTVLELGPGDRLYLFSDGLLEERDAEGEILGQERVMGTIGAQAGTGLDASLDALVAEVVRWRGSETLHDDVAVVAAELSAPRG